ncbi:glycine--tRNA ligase subunit beta [Niallia sp. Krafla_26]|uniref:glycine--tRNA ligase subunit beta n=1 Tax=Niallia sp. Krafla_26 TaxID=3064703 RepID=UPI003D175676
MAAKDILLEIGLEELPARFVTDSMNQLSDKIKDWLQSKKISYHDVQAYSTPRRLAVLVSDVAHTQEDVHEEAKGPARKIALNENGEWTKAAMGFTRGQGMTVEDIYFKEINGVEYAHVNKFIQGKKTVDLLPELRDIVTSIHFPKNMRWANYDMRYIRPIKWITALYGQEIIPFSITDVHTSNDSLGHRFLGGKFQITNPGDYEELLIKQYVIADPTKRKTMILDQLKQLEEQNNWTIPVDEDLLEEVNNLVEYPTALYGGFEEEFLELPEEVLITSMKEHQRYFPVKSKDGKLLPHFVTVRNGGSDYLENVAKGNEKVLRARLSDADFFYREDQKLEIDHFLNKLQSIVYHEEIGTLAQKVERVRNLTNILTEKLSFSNDDKQAADRAAQICKFDLVTNMVYEFPELQGFMGEKYARQKGESEAVAVAINEHYMPRNAEDQTPTSEVGAILAVAEKMDTIASFFAIDMIPSGSQDPYALRRQATGIVQILLHKDWNIYFEDLIHESISLLQAEGKLKQSVEHVTKELVGFFKLRLKHLLQEKSIRYDLIDAVLGDDLGDIHGLFNRAEVLEAKKDEADFKENIEALSRVLNIASKAVAQGEINESLFENDHEQRLYERYGSVKQQLSHPVSEETYYELLVSMKLEINQYFDHTMIMVDDEKVKQNRLNLMLLIAELIKKFANVNDIITKS